MNITLLYVDKPFSEYSHLLHFVLPERQSKIKNLKLDCDKSLSLLSHLLARYKISQSLNMPFSDVIFKHNEYGKPYIEKDNFHFSVSHSGNVVAFVSYASPVGIDIQQITNKKDFPALRFMTQNEQDFIGNNPDNFFKIWTMKEAYVKMLGTGLSTAFKSFDVLSDNLKNKFFTTSVSSYRLSVCAEDIQPQHINIEQVN